MLNGRVIIGQDSSTRVSPIVEVNDRPLIVYGFGITADTTVSIVRVFSDDSTTAMPTSLSTTNNPVVLNLSGRYQLTAAGSTAVTVVAYYQGDYARSGTQPYAAEVQRPNPLFNSESSDEFSAELVVEQPTLIQASGLADDATVEVYAAYGESTARIVAGGTSTDLTEAAPTLLLANAGRYKFKLTDGIGDSLVVATPQNVLASPAAGTQSSGGGGGGGGSPAGETNEVQVNNAGDFGGGGWIAADGPGALSGAAHILQQVSTSVKPYSLLYAGTGVGNVAGLLWGDVASAYSMIQANGSGGELSYFDQTAGTTVGVTINATSLVMLATIGGSTTSITITEDTITFTADNFVGLPQGAAVADATDEASAVTQLNALLASLRASGAIAT